MGSPRPTVAPDIPPTVPDTSRQDATLVGARMWDLLVRMAHQQSANSPQTAELRVL
ncbi:MAG TPA: hypothetical protein VGA36_11115 [Nitriliruptorales bacterium]